MKVKTLGKRENPGIIMIPGMFCTSEMPEIVANLLKDEYFFILPTLDGHHVEEPTYFDKETEGLKLSRWLEANGIDQLAMIQGTSMGAEVALELTRQLSIPVDHYLFDGGPFFHFPKPFREVMAKKFMMFMDTVRGKEKDDAINALMQDPFVEKLGGESLESYRGLMGGFCDVSQWIDSGSVRRIADTCYCSDLPELPRDKVENFVFLYSENEPARKAEKRLQKQYPEAIYLTAKGYGHGGLQSEAPEKYARLMRNILNNRTEDNWK